MNRGLVTRYPSTRTWESHAAEAEERCQNDAGPPSHATKSWSSRPTSPRDWSRIGTRRTRPGCRATTGSSENQQSPFVTVIDFDHNDMGDANVDLERWFGEALRGKLSGWVGRNDLPFWKQNQMWWDDDVTAAGLAGGFKWSAGRNGTMAIHAAYVSLPVGMQRSFVLFDFLRDGWQDIAIVNANAPFLQLFQNQIGDRAEGGEEAGILAFRFVGGNHASSPSSNWSNRDGYGAKVVVDLGDRKLLRELRCGDGFAAQNSATLIAGLGNAREAESLSVSWPSGKRQTFTSVAAGTLVTVSMKIRRSRPATIRSCSSGTRSIPRIVAYGPCNRWGTRKKPSSWPRTRLPVRRPA